MPATIKRKAGNRAPPSESTLAYKLKPIPEVMRQIEHITIEDKRMRSTKVPLLWEARVASGAGSWKTMKME
jgi:hypothetical protein